MATRAGCRTWWWMVMGWDEASSARRPTTPEDLARAVQAPSSTGRVSQCLGGDRRQPAPRTRTRSSRSGPRRAHDGPADGSATRTGAGTFRLTAANWDEVMSDRPTRALWASGPRPPTSSPSGPANRPRAGRCRPCALAADPVRDGTWYVPVGRASGAPASTRRRGAAGPQPRDDLPGEPHGLGRGAHRVAALARWVAQDGPPKAGGPPGMAVKVRSRRSPPVPAARPSQRRRPTRWRRGGGARGAGPVHRPPPGAPPRGARGVRGKRDEPALVEPPDRVATVPTAGADGAGAGQQHDRSRVPWPPPACRPSRHRPLSRVTHDVERCSTSSARSASTVNGPGSSSTWQRIGSGGPGGSTARSRNHRSSRSGERREIAPTGGQEHPASQSGQLLGGGRGVGTRCSGHGSAVHPGPSKHQQREPQDAAAATACARSARRTGASRRRRPRCGARAATRSARRRPRTHRRGPLRRRDRHRHPPGQRGRHGVAAAGRCSVAASPRPPGCRRIRTPTHGDHQGSAVAAGRCP